MTDGGETSVPSERLSRRGLFRGGLGRLLREGDALIGSVAEGIEPPSARGDDDAAHGPARYRRAVAEALDGPPRGGLGRLLAPVVETVISRSGAEPGGVVLDAGAGEGEAAIAAGRRKLAVTACEPVPGRVARGRELSTAAGVGVEWVVADLDRLPFAEHRFDHVISCFGTTFSPAPGRTLAELFRVLRPGGTVAISTWSEAGFIGEALELGAALSPPPRGVEHPSRWGRYETLYRHLMGLAPHFDCTERTVRLELDSAERLWEALAFAPGPLAPARASLAPEGRERLRDGLHALADRHGEAGAGGSLRLEATYMLTTAIA